LSLKNLAIRNPVRASEVRKIGRLRNLRKLRISWPDSEYEEIMSLTPLAALTELEELSFWNTGALAGSVHEMSFEGLRDLMKLKQMEFDMLPNLRGLTPNWESFTKELGDKLEVLTIPDAYYNMAPMTKLKQLFLPKSTHRMLDNVLPLKYQLTKMLPLCHDQIPCSYRNLTTLAEFTQLEIPHLFPDYIRDFNELLAWPRPDEVKTLNLSRSTIEHINHIGAFRNLETLILPTSVKDFSGLADLRKLKNFTIVRGPNPEARFFDLHLLAPSASSIESLSFYGVLIDSFQGVNLFTKLKSFELFRFAPQQVDITPFRSLTNLRHLHLHNCGSQDFSGIRVRSGI
jgi:hypothetical protein